MPKLPILAGYEIGFDETLHRYAMKLVDGSMLSLQLNSLGPAVLHAEGVPAAAVQILLERAAEDGRLQTSQRVKMGVVPAPEAPCLICGKPPSDPFCTPYAEVLTPPKKDGSQEQRIVCARCWQRVLLCQFEYREANPVTHEIKSWPLSFGAILDGSKAYDLRKKDRDYQPGDFVDLREYNPDGPQKGQYTGRRCKKRISTMVSPDFSHGALHQDYVLLGLSDAGEHKPESAGARRPMSVDRFEQLVDDFCGRNSPFGDLLSRGEPQPVAESTQPPKTPPDATERAPGAFERAWRTIGNALHDALLFGERSGRLKELHDLYDALNVICLNLPADLSPLRRANVVRSLLALYGTILSSTRPA